MFVNSALKLRFFGGVACSGLLGAPVMERGFVVSEASHIRVFLRPVSRRGAFVVSEASHLWDFLGPVSRRGVLVYRRRRMFRASWGPCHVAGGQLMEQILHFFASSVHLV